MNDCVVVFEHFVIQTSVLLASRLLTDDVWCGSSALLAAGFLVSLAVELTDHPSSGPDHGDEAVVFDSVSCALKVLLFSANSFLHSNVRVISDRSLNSVNVERQQMFLVDVIAIADLRRQGPVVGG